MLPHTKALIGWKVHHKSSDWLKIHAIKWFGQSYGALHTYTPHAHTHTHTRTNRTKPVGRLCVSDIEKVTKFIPSEKADISRTRNEIRFFFRVPQKKCQMKKWPRRKNLSSYSSRGNGPGRISYTPHFRRDSPASYATMKAMSGIWNRAVNFRHAMTLQWLDRTLVRVQCS